METGGNHIGYLFIFMLSAAHAISYASIVYEHSKMQQHEKKGSYRESEDSKRMWTTPTCHAVCEPYYKILHGQHCSMLGSQCSLGIFMHVCVYGSVCVCVCAIELQ